MKFTVCIPQVSKRFRWIPYRMTLKSNPAIYRWLWFNWSFDERVVSKTCSCVGIESCAVCKDGLDIS